jgi:hypothetical protein
MPAGTAAPTATPQDTAAHELDDGVLVDPMTVIFRRELTSARSSTHPASAGVGSGPPEWVVATA